MPTVAASAIAESGQSAGGAADVGDGVAEADSGADAEGEADALADADADAVAPDGGASDAGVEPGGADGASGEVTPAAATRCEPDGPPEVPPEAENNELSPQTTRTSTSAAPAMASALRRRYTWRECGQDGWSMPRT